MYVINYYYVINIYRNKLCVINFMLEIFVQKKICNKLLVGIVFYF